MEYRDYLRTPHWQKVRAAALERAGYCCQLCPSKKNIEVHHRTYVRRGKERPTDVIALCGDCHGVFHKYRRVTHRGASRELLALVKKQIGDAA